VEDDFYVFDPTRNNLVGRRTRRTIRLGDKVTVQVAKVDTFKKQVDFRLATEERPRNARPGTGNRFAGKAAPPRNDRRSKPSRRRGR
jgi:ribonuclease R